jgi:hypothetical protein
MQWQPTIIHAFYVFQRNAGSPLQTDSAMDRRREKGRRIHSFAPGKGVKMMSQIGPSLVFFKIYFFVGVPHLATYIFLNRELSSITTRPDLHPIPLLS